MDKEFIPYDEALALKELGFNEPCFAYYSNARILSIFYNTRHSDRTNSNHTVTVPLYQQAFRWFREKYNMCGEINSYYSDKKWTYNFDIVTIYKEKASDLFDTYEEAELACLKKLIEIVKKS